jgi:hypothetical protein
MAMGIKKDEKLIKRIKQDPFIEHAAKECYESLLHIFYSLTVEKHDKKYGRSCLLVPLTNI